MPNENLTALLLFISAMSAGGCLCGMMAWITAATTAHKLAWLERDVQRVREHLDDEHGWVRDMHNDLQSIQRLAAERDKLIRAAAGVKVEVK